MQVLTSCFLVHQSAVCLVYSTQEKKECIVLMTEQKHASNSEPIELASCLTAADAAAKVLSLTELKGIVHDDSKVAFTLSGVLSAKECQALIDRTETLGYVGLGDSTDGRMRNNTRCKVLDEQLAQQLWLRVKSYMPADIKVRSDKRTWRPVGINEMFRFCKYGADQFFRRHCDGNYVESATKMSLLTFMVYLNDVPGDCGGSTRFFRHDNVVGNVLAVSVQPVAGMAIVFDHDMLHDGATFVPTSTAGAGAGAGERGAATKAECKFKYIMRSEVMFECDDVAAE